MFLSFLSQGLFLENYRKKMNTIYFLLFTRNNWYEPCIFHLFFFRYMYKNVKEKIYFTLYAQHVSVARKC